MQNILRTYRNILYIFIYVNLKRMLFFNSLIIFLLHESVAKTTILQTRDVPDLLIIDTDKGRVRGSQAETIDTGKTYYSFRGIPFAQPPINQLRFEPPIPAKSWDGILNATEDQNGCVQIIDTSPFYSGSEDCLYINVYTPKLPGESRGSLLPVMVWIYGGGFTSGISNYATYGPDFFLDEEVIFVSFNYRLGIFGFLSTGDLVAPGNAALKDQVLALKWVQTNIARFGGDPKKVTVFGQSAGAGSVSYLLQSPLAKGLFHGAILESGSSLGHLALSRRSRQAAFQTGTLLHLDTSNSESLVKGLKTVNYVQLQQIATVVQSILFLQNITHGYIYAPVKEPNHDNAFFTGKSHVLLRSGQFHRVPIIIGFNSLEIKFELNPIIRLYLAKYDLNPSDLVPIDMNVNSISVLRKVGNDIHKHYWGNIPITLAPDINTLVYASDDFFNRPIRENVQLQAKYVPVYFYVFSYEGVLGGSTNSSIRGVQHAAELNYLFVVNKTASLQDIVTRRRIVKLWTNFAKYKDPTPNREELFQNVTWPVAAQGSNVTNLKYLDLDSDLKIKVNPFEANMKYWKNLYATYGHAPYDTY